MSTAPLEDSAVDDFAVRLFDMLGYTSRGVVLRTRKDIELVICGISMHAKTDVCLLAHRSQIILLFQEDKQHLEDRGDAEAQLIAEGIAAFQSNNKKCILAGLLRLILGIVMIGSVSYEHMVALRQHLGITNTRDAAILAVFSTAFKDCARLGELVPNLKSRTLFNSIFHGQKLLASRGVGSSPPVAMILLTVCLRWNIILLSIPTFLLTRLFLPLKPLQVGQPSLLTR
jgi:hypothetical protein